MSRDVPLRDAILPLHGSTAAAVAWRSKGQLRVTAIVKATFSLVHSAEMARVAPHEILSAEVHHGDNPSRSVRFTNDLAPYLGAADVLLTGVACAPPGAPVQSLRVRLGIFEGSRVLLDKSAGLHDPAGFERMPLVYERSYGGMSFPDNPLGVGAAAGSPEPNIVDPSDPRRTIGFGPIARSWPARRKLLGATPRAALEAPIAEIPDGFDWQYFQAAPPDQRTAFLRGDEWIVMDGLHPTLARVQTRLPGARGVARVHGLSSFGVAEGLPLDFHADTLRIDSEQQVCSVVWRSNFVVPNEAALAEVRIAAGVELRSEPLTWIVPPARVERAPSLARPGAAAAATSVLAPSAGSTIAVSADRDQPARDAPALPFQPSSALSPISRPSAQRPPVKDRSGSGTVAASPADEDRLRDAPALPFQNASPASAPGRPRTPPPVKDRSGAGTVAVSPDSGASVLGAPVMPFQATSTPSPLSQPGPRKPFKDRSGSGTVVASIGDEARASSARVMPFAGAAPEPPSSVAPDEASPPPLPDPAPSAPPLSEPPAPEPPAPAAIHHEPAISPWAPQQEEAPQAEAPPAPLRPAPAPVNPALKKPLYGRFGPKR